VCVRMYLDFFLLPFTFRSTVFSSESISVVQYDHLTRKDQQLISEEKLPQSYVIKAHTS
jgi:hypothetical protein